jgi:hypothetical protein
MISGLRPSLARISSRRLALSLRVQQCHLHVRASILFQWPEIGILTWLSLMAVAACQISGFLPVESRRNTSTERKVSHLQPR